MCLPESLLFINDGCRTVPPELGVLVDTSQEDGLVLVLEGEVEGLCGEVTDHVGQVTAPKGQETLLLGDANQAVDYTWRKQVIDQIQINLKIKNRLH